MLMATKAPHVRSPRAAVPDYLIVARDHAGLCQAVREVAEDNFTVIVDRRKTERRQHVQPVLEDRRHGERRSSSAIVATTRPWHVCWSASAAARRLAD